jgi:hypothetical protein
MKNSVESFDLSEEEKEMKIQDILTDPKHTKSFRGDQLPFWELPPPPPPTCTLLFMLG